jgi:histidyl-tRNA synthetase
MARGALPGFRDFFPEEFSERAYIMRTWREVARRYGFFEYDGPPLEPLDLYTKKSGEEIVGQLYSFTDKGGREVSLRPEMTPTVARMVGERANALRKPVRWFSMPQLFRYERQQKGRLREHFQLNVDLFGEAGVAADAELVAAAIDIMRAFGLTSADVRVRFSDRRVLNALLAARGVPESAHGAVYGVLDKLERQPRDVSLARLVAGGLSDDAAEGLLAFVEASVASGTLDSMRGAGLTGDGAERLADVDRYAAAVSRLIGEDASAWLRWDLSIVRGLAYYTGIVFEIFDARGEFRAVCGGGRYDNLLQALGGADLPALGFGMGDVVLGELLRARGLMPDSAPAIDAWVAPAEGASRDAVLEAVGALRRLGHSVEYALRAQKPDKQQKAALAAGARLLVLVPPAFEADRRVHAAPARERVPARLDAAQLVPLETALRPPPDGRAGPAGAAA